MNQLHVIIKSRDRMLFDGPAAAVSSVNDRGKFDILAGHANFISIIKDTLVIHRPDSADQSFPVTSGVLKVYENTVQIYLGIVET